MKRRSRRALLVGAATGAAGVTGLTIAGKTLLNAADTRVSSEAIRQCSATPVQDILNITVTLERLAVTFYSNTLAHAHTLGIGSADQLYLKAALIEEQLHAHFFEQVGGKALISIFSFPKGPATFTNLTTFIITQQQIEGLFDSVYLCAVREFAMQDRLDLAQSAAQIACIEAEHRLIGRLIGRMQPAEGRPQASPTGAGSSLADNWSFAPIIFSSVGDAAGIIQQAGYFNPIPNNLFPYHPAPTDDPNITYRSPFAVSCPSS
ncbi:MAG TPA: ferritin-like domain-containing protein [Ktedonosporobacter sp.]|nr:ferritin-like domain-containing protein [Ktedonosporobacter sp.]